MVAMTQQLTHARLKNKYMDTKRTILWAVFSIAGLLLYNNWLAYEGKTPLFGPQSMSKQEAAPVSGDEKKSDVPVSTATCTSACTQSNSSEHGAAGKQRALHFTKRRTGN